MAVVIVEEKVTVEDLEKAREEYGEYVKIVVDVETGAMAIGGEWHADAEKVLQEAGHKSLWGGGLNLKTKEIDYTSLINVRGGVNPSHVILDVKVREMFDKIVKGKFGL